MIDAHTLTVAIGASTAVCTEASITEDRGWSPRVQGDIAIAGGHDLDPRRGDRVRLQFRQAFGFESDLASIDAMFTGMTLADIDAGPWAGTLEDIDRALTTPFEGTYRPATFKALNLHAQAAEHDVRGDESQVFLASDEALAQQHKLVSIAPLGFGLDVRTNIGQALARIGGRLQPGTATATLEEPPVWAPGQDLWGFVTPQVEYGGLVLFCDAQRAWHLNDMDTVAPGAITLSTRVSIVDAKTRIARDGALWGDAVIVVYRWIDDLGVAHERVDVAGSDTATNPLVITHERTRYPGPGAAARILARARRRGREVPVDAVNDYTVTPSMGVTITTARLRPQIGRVRRVTWTAPDWRMTLDASDLESIELGAINAYPPDLTINQLVGTINQQIPEEY